MEIDLPALRTERLVRLQGAMSSHGVDVCLLFNEPNIRYATGASPMPIWSNTTFVRAALVPVEGPPTLFVAPGARWPGSRTCWPPMARSGRRSSRR